ncbi:hypothetical protein [Moorena producens]|uniref:hypothetical protein n=1 Tax=Moorena producens TaxID=1155739 RepID=UPI003C72A77E
MGETPKTALHRFPPLALGYVAARNAPPCQTTKMRCTQNSHCHLQTKSVVISDH